MEFSRLGGELEIRLSARDSARLGFSEEPFDFQNAKQRAVLWQLLEAARQETGFCVPKECLRVHLYEKRDGSLSFFLRECASGERCFLFFGIDAFLCARRQGLFFEEGACLYRRGEHFFLKTKNAHPRLLEYADAVSARCFLHGIEGARRQNL